MRDEFLESSIDLWIFFIRSSVKELLGEGRGSVWIFLLLGFLSRHKELRRCEMQGVEERFNDGRTFLLFLVGFIFEL